MLQYSTEPICATIGDNRPCRCALHGKFGVKYSAYRPVYAVWTVVPDKRNAITAPYIQTSIFIWTYLPCYWRYLDNSLRVIQQTWCQIQQTSSSLCYVNCGPRHIQSIYSSAYSVFNIQLKVDCHGIWQKWHRGLEKSSCEVYETNRTKARDIGWLNLQCWDGQGA
jgi:hypothetical protein